MLCIDTGSCKQIFLRNIDAEDWYSKFCYREQVYSVGGKRTNMESSGTHDDKLRFSRHACMRQEQRDIPDRSVSEAMERGEQYCFKASTIYTDQNTKVVVDSDRNTVLTVNKNTRNTRFQLDERTQRKKESLLIKVDVEGNNNAMCELADLYASGELGEKDIDKAYDLLERAARKGSSHAMCKISMMHASGELGAPDQELSNKWLEKAADRGNTFALGMTGQLLLNKYKEEYPVGSNLYSSKILKRKILHYLNKAADKGNSRGTWQLGCVYEKGLLGEQDLSKAIELYVKAAKTGSPASLDSLYSLTLESKFGVQEFEEILDDVSAMLPTTSIGMALQIGQKQLEGELGCNPVRGLKMIEQAALKQYDEAILQLAICHRDGIACDVNLKLAQYWFMKLCDLYKLSAEGGNVASLWKLGELYLNGNVGDIDLEKAESCFNEAVQKTSNPDWIYNLGMLYLEGRLGNKPTDIGTRHIAEAIKIWKRQAAQGDVNAYFHLGIAYLSINSHKNAAYWFSKAPVHLTSIYSLYDLVPSNNVDSLKQLVKLYLDNSSPEKNISLGLEILENIALEYNIDFSTVVEINDETVRGLQERADKIKKDVPRKKLQQRKFERYIITILAKVYEEGYLGEKDYDLASKYYNELFVDFESMEAGNKLVWLYINQNLPAKYHDTAKNWALRIPTLFETSKINYHLLFDCVSLLAKLYQNSVFLSYDVKEATKWLHLASYFYVSHKMFSKKDIEHDLENLPQLDDNQKLQIVSESSEMTQNMKNISLQNYKVMSRILGDIFYDNKIINRDIDKAVYWYTESAMLNNGLASLTLGKIYQHKGDIDASVKWYMLSVQDDNQEALKELRNIYKEQHLESLSSFLDTFQHQSLVKDSELLNVKTLKNLELYPQTRREMYELGKHYLDLEDRQDIHVQDAAFWFRKAMNQGSIDAATELHSMYKSGILGNHLTPVADVLYPDILDMCYFKLKRIPLQMQNTSAIVSLLNDVSSVLKLGRTASSISLNRKIERMTSEADNIDTATLKDVIADFESLKRELCSECPISDDLENISLSG